MRSPARVVAPIRVKRGSVIWTLRAFGPGLAILPNDNFLEPSNEPRFPEYVAVVENNEISPKRTATPRPSDS